MILEGCSLELKSLVIEGFTVFFHVRFREYRRLVGTWEWGCTSMETPWRGVSTFVRAIIDRPYKRFDIGFRVDERYPQPQHAENKKTGYKDDLLISCQMV